MSKAATIIRAKHDKENPYFQMRRDTIQNENLSWEARGMLCYLLSKPADWEIQISDLKQKCGRAKVYAILDELIKANYIKERQKFQDEKGHWQWTPYIVYELPIAHTVEEKIISMPETSVTVSQKPEHGKPYTESWEILQNTEEQKIETNTTSEPMATETKITIAPKESNLTTGNTPDKKPAEWLADAMGIKLVKKDWSLYTKIAKELIDAGIPEAEFGQYVGRIRKISKQQKNWNVTVNSLVSNGRMSEYVTARDHYTAQQKTVLSLDEKQKEIEAHEAFMLSVLRRVS